ncbi:MAG: DUF4114 domain-containing protein, partial [Phycisphaerae bacterium]
MKRSRVFALLVGTLVLPTASLFAGYSTVGTPPSGEATHVEILENTYGGTFVGSGTDLGNGLWSVFDNGTVTATRVDDFGLASLLNMLTGSPGSGDDDTWTDGTATAVAEARFAGYAQEFGYDAGLSYVKLFDVSGSGYSASGSAVITFGTGAIWEWARADDSDGGLDNVHYSEESSNTDGLDHLVTYNITGLPGLPASTKVWLLFWEDVSGTGSDRDFNDLVVELQAVDCVTDAECDDESYCNGVEVCVDGACVPGPPVDCDDSVDCTIDTCDDDNDTCTHTPNDNACNDGQYCNGV